MPEHEPPENVQYNTPPATANGRITEAALKAAKSVAQLEEVQIRRLTVLLHTEKTLDGEDGMTAGYYRDEEMEPETVLTHTLSNAQSMLRALGGDMEILSSPPAPAPLRVRVSGFPWKDRVRLEMGPNSDRVYAVLGEDRWDITDDFDEMEAKRGEGMQKKAALFLGMLQAIVEAEGERREELISRVEQFMDAAEEKVQEVTRADWASFREAADD